MTDMTMSMRREAPRFWPIEHLPEILAFFIMIAMAQRLPSIAKYTTLAWLGMLGMLMIVRRKELAKTLLHWWPLLLVPLLALASYFWSDLPAVSARYGFQLLLTALAGVLVARTIPPSRMLNVLFLSMFAFCVLCVASGRKGAGFDGDVLIGLVGSKNQMAFVAYLLVFSGLTTLFDIQSPRLVRLLALPGMALGAYIVMTTESATAIVITGLSIATFVGLAILHPLKPAGRAGAFIAIIVVASPVLALLPEITQGVNDFIFNVLHKDPGLTGRTYLWARADDLIARRPVLGYGFQAIWLGEKSETLGLLRWAHQTDGRVFNFHHTYRQFAVDTGLVGMGVLIATVAASLFAVARQYVMRPSIATTFFAILLMTNIARSFFEVVLIVAFNFQTMLAFLCLTYAFWRPEPAGAGAAPQSGPAVGLAPGMGWARYPAAGGEALRLPWTSARR